MKSGSSGNCTAIWTERSAILVDCGGRTSRESFRQMLREIDLRPAKINGILVTHGHGDHVNSDTFKIAKEFRIPIYIHRMNLDNGYYNIRREYVKAAPDEIKITEVTRCKRTEVSNKEYDKVKDFFDKPPNKTRVAFCCAEDI